MFKNPLLPKQLRFYIIQAFFILFFLILCGQLFYIQVIKSPGLISQAKKRFYKNNIILRGDIRDRNGDLLVLDVVTYDLYNNVRDLKKVSNEQIVNLAQILNVEPDKLKEKLKQKIDTRITSKINQDIATKIRENKINFVYLRPTLSRVYPHKHLAAHIIGFVNNDHIGQHGVEYSHDKLLTKVTKSDGDNAFFPKGASIVLTIDSILQKQTEEILKKSIKKTKAQKGTVLILSPKTGEVYTWAVYPSFDPNKFYKEKNTKNWALTDIYEPGSTFKAITVSSALENMVINKESTFLDEGKIVVSRRVIRNHHMTEPTRLNLLEVFKKSSNVVASKIGLKMEPKDFYNSIKKFKIGEKTNIDLPGESQGLLLNYKKWREVDSASTAIGQGAVSVTPIQISSAISAIANEGVWTQPHVLKGIWEPNYKLISESPYKINKKQIISKDTADFVSSLLMKSVEENLEAMAYIAGNIPGYKVAGKTGTAQKIKPKGKGYWFGHTIASFIGYFPAEDPELLILVVIDDPKTDGRWGNTVAGPVFNEVGRFAAKRLLERT